MTRLFSDYVSAYPDTPIYRNAIALARNGYAVIPVEAGGKKPLCTWTARQRNANPDHACGVHHAITDAVAAGRVFKRLEQEIGRPTNIGIVAHPSRLVVVDVDTSEAKETFLHRWAQGEEDQGYMTRSPTVSTPGSRRGDEWKHYDGGHYYFDLPEGIVLPAMPGQLQLAGGADVRWGTNMTVCPPSVRPEGAYVVHGDIPDIPFWLLAVIRDRVEEQVFKAVKLSERYANDGVVQWSIDVPWAALLMPHGWTDVNKADRCGCPIFEKPAGGSSGPKSATAHEGTCTVMENIEGHGALHLWTTEPPPELEGRRNVTKLQFYALMEHDGDEAAAELALGLTPDYGALWDTSGHSDSPGTPYGVEMPAECPQPDSQPADQGEQPSSGPATASPEAPPDRHPLTAAAERIAAHTGMSAAKAHKLVGDEWARREAKAALDLYFGAEAGDGSSWLPRGQEEMARAMLRDRSQRAEGVLERSDGATLFPAGKLHELFGQSSAGKTFLMMMAILQQVRAGHRCLFVDFEDTLETFVDRYVVDMGVDIRPFIDAGLLCYANPSEPPADLTPLINMRFRLVVVDSLSEVVSATADGSLKDGVLIKRIFGNFRQMSVAGAAVVVIAHGSEKVDVPGTSLGASEIRQALTGQDVLLQEKRPFDARTAGHSLIYVAKDRGSDAGGDSDMDERAASKVQRRLWGAMTVTPSPPDPLLGTTAWHTAIEIDPALHVDQEPPKTRAIDVAEQLVIKHLRDQPNETARQADMADELVDEEGQKERTIRRAVRKLLEAGMVHEIGQESTGGRPSAILKLGPAPT